MSFLHCPHTLPISLGICWGKANLFPVELLRVRNASLNRIPPAREPTCYFPLLGVRLWWVTPKAPAGGCAVSPTLGKAADPFWPAETHHFFVLLGLNPATNTKNNFIKTLTTFSFGNSAFSPSAPYETGNQQHAGALLVLLPPLLSLQIWSQ